MVSEKNDNGTIVAEANPAALMQLAGIKTPEIGEALCNSQLLRATLERWLSETLPGYPDEIGPEERDLFMVLERSGSEGLEQLARCIALFINHELVFLETNGQVLRVLAGWCGSEKVVRHAATSRQAVPEAISALSVFDQEELVAQTRRIFACLVGLMPEAFRARLTLRCEPGSLPQPEKLIKTDMKDLTRLAIVATGLMVNG